MYCLEIRTGLIAQRLLIYGALAVLLAAAIPLAKAEKAEISPLYENALERFEQRDFQGAIIQLKSTLQKNPDYLPARILLGRIYLEIKEIRAAIKELSIARRAGADDALILVPITKAYEQLGQHGRILAETRRSTGDPDVDVDILMARGKAYMALGKLDKAQRAFAEVARARPDSPAAFVESARLQMRRGDPAAAEELVGAARHRAPNHPEVWFVSGDLKRFKRDLAGAVSDFGKVLDLDPEHSAVRVARAGTLIDMGRHADAAFDVEHLLANDPINARAHYFHALILSSMAKPKEAEVALNRAAAILQTLDPEEIVESPPTLLLAGMVAFLTKDFETARVHLERYIEASPRHMPSRRLLARIMLQRGETDAAIKLLREARKIAPNDVRVLALLGDALMRRKQHAEAAEALERAAALAPDDATILRNLGMSRLNTGQDAQATEALQRAVALDSGGGSAAALLSFAQLKQGRFADALKTASAIVSKDPDNAVAHNVIGGAQMALGKFEEARASFDRALEIDPTYPSPRFNLARMALLRGDLAAGEAHYRVVLEKNDRSVRAMIGLARIAERRGETGAAIRWLEKVRTADPRQVNAQIALSRLYGFEGDLDVAMQVLQALVRNVPRSPTALQALAAAQRDAGASEAAVKSYNRLVTWAEGRRSPEWLVRAARQLAELESYKTARDALASAVRLDKKFLPAHAALFDLDMRLGQLRSAERRAKDLRLDFPESAVGVTLLGDLEMRRGRPDLAATLYREGFWDFATPALLIRWYKAQRDVGRAKDMIGPLETWLRKNPEDAKVRRVYAKALMDVGRDADAVRLHETLLQSAQNDPALLNNLALLYHKSGDARALPYAERAYKGAPRSAGTLDTYGWLLVLNGQTEKGLEMLRNAQARAPKVADIDYHIAVALHRLGRRDEAKQILDKLLTSDRVFSEQSDAHALWRELSGG